MNLGLAPRCLPPRIDGAGKAGARTEMKSTREIVRFGTVGSTQVVAFELAEQGAADATVVVAETQTAGRGRLGRKWHDEPGESLLMSIVVRPHLTARDLPKLSLATAVAVADAIGVATDLEPRIKWPNDVLVNGRKVAGILLESRIVTEPIVVAGIGINLRQRSFSAPLAGTATSVHLEGGRAVEREAMMEAVLMAFDRWRARLEGEGFPPVRARWLALSDTIGRAVTVGGQAGVAVDIDGDGALVLRQARGTHSVVAGELTESRRD
jgi:BirA family biotin operon repressor/biotin-[acetyl-CoA-carboxylase] ligase